MPVETRARTFLPHLRWYICGLLFFATTVNYIDRQVLGLLKPVLEKDLGWREADYGWIVFAFQLAYTLMMPFAGRLIDRLGTRLGYLMAVVVWSFAAMAHSLARNTLQFGLARFALGFGESANFPAAIKTVAEWFPKRERALATGIFNSGANIGAIVAPAAAPWIAVRLGWQWAFVFMGALSAIWVVPWLIGYRRPEEHSKVSAAELRYIQSDPQDSQVVLPWSQLIPHRQTWAYLIGKFLTDPIWWFFLFWLPKFLYSQYGLALTDLGWPLVTVYTMSMAGSVGGGWLPAKFLKLGWSLNAARKTAMLLCAVAVVPVMAAAGAGHLWLSVALVGLATAAHQGWSANLYTIVSDTFPKHAVGSVIGIGGFGGAVGGMLIATFTGWLLQVTGSYVPVFLIAGSAYVVALIVIQLLVPKLEPARIDKDA